MKLRFRRILLKISGEALSASARARDEAGFDAGTLHHLVQEIKNVCDAGVQMGLVVGGGNFYRGRFSQGLFSAVTGDYLGMLATMMNGLVLRDVLNAAGVVCILQSALPVFGVIEPYQRDKVFAAMKQGQVVIFVGGTGHPFFTTDTASALRAVEIGADALLKATLVDGVYSADPKSHKEAQRYEKLTYDEAIMQKLEVMDATAFTLCREHNLPLVVYDFFKKKALLRIVCGEAEGTTVSKSNLPS